MYSEPPSYKLLMYLTIKFGEQVNGSALNFSQNTENRLKTNDAREILSPPHLGCLPGKDVQGYKRVQVGYLVPVHHWVKGLEVVGKRQRRFH